MARSRYVVRSIWFASVLLSLAGCGESAVPPAPLSGGANGVDAGVGGDGDGDGNAEPGPGDGTTGSDGDDLPGSSTGDGDGDGTTGGDGDGTSGDGASGDGATGGDGSAGDGSAGDGSAGDGSAGDGSAGDGSAGDGSAGDGSAGGDQCLGAPGSQTSETDCTGIETFAVQGRVLNAKTGQGVSGANIKSATCGVQSTSSGDGSFSIEVPNGDFLRLEKTGFVGALSEYLNLTGPVDLDLLMVEPAAIADFRQTCSSEPLLLLSLAGSEKTGALLEATTGESISYVGSNLASLVGATATNSAGFGVAHGFTPPSFGQIRISFDGCTPVETGYGPIEQGYVTSLRYTFSCVAP